jgi:hypothetical protein
MIFFDKNGVKVLGVEGIDVDGYGGGIGNLVKEGHRSSIFVV